MTDLADDARDCDLADDPRDGDLADDPRGGPDDLLYVGGPDGGKPIAFVHGAGLSWRMWLPQLRAFDGEFRVLAPDLPGHGRRAGEPFSLDAAVTVLVDAVGGDRPSVLVGQSLGAYVAIEYAYRRPGRVAGLVLSGAGADYRGWLGAVTYLAGLFNRVRAAVGPLERRFREGVASDLDARGLPADVVEAILDGGISLSGYGQGAMALSGVDFPGKLRTYDGPVTFVNGAEDRLNPDAAESLASTLPAADSRVIPGAGHTCSLHRPDEYTAIVREFVGERVWTDEDGPEGHR